MTCRFCGHERPLVDAHIIPKSFFRIDPSDTGPFRLVTNVEGRYSQKVPKGVYDPALVCLDCERQFSSWDDYGHEILINSWSQFAPIPHEGRTVGYFLPAYDYSNLKLFFLSVLWRISASSVPMFASVNLGPREAALKELIRRNDPGSKDDFGVVLQAFDIGEVGILNPHSERFGSLRFVRVYLGHLIAFIEVDSRLFNEPFGSMALQPGIPLVAAFKSFHQSKEKQLMQRLVQREIAQRAENRRQK